MIKSEVPVVIFAGGLGSRLEGHSATVPKPLVSVGGVPILYRIMERYSAFGFNTFLILGGHLVDVLRSRLVGDSKGLGDVEIDFGAGSVRPLAKEIRRDWHIKLVDTGEDSETGLRLAKASAYLEDSQTIFLTYGDGLSDIDFQLQLENHVASGKLATISAVKSPSKYGHIEISQDNQVSRFVEKPDFDGTWINGGFFVMQTSALKLLDHATNVPLETSLLPELARRGQLNAFCHTGFWRSMDTPKDKAALDVLAKLGHLPVFN